MKDLLLRIVLAVAALIATLAIIGSLLPRSFDLSTEIVIDAPQAVVFEQVNNLRNWAEWSSWSPKRIEGLEVEYGPNTVGEGASQRWEDVRGEGKIWITESVTDTSIEYELEFQTFSEMHSRFEFSDANGKTKVVWSSAGQLPSGPFYGFFAFLFETGMRDQYEQNLARLKTTAESIAKN